eukprot:jgi/Undpi1/10964/HiC_scaffold_30.g13265.m1
MRSTFFAEYSKRMHESHRAALRAMPTPSSVSHAACAFFVTSSVAAAAAAAAETEADAGGFTYAPEHKASAIKFQDVCESLEKMPEQSKLEGKLDLLTPFLARLGQESAFPFMRLILPELDNLRDKYGMKTAKLAKMFASLYFATNDVGYTRLRSYTDPSKNPSPGDTRWQITADFPLTLEYVLTHTPGLEVVEKTNWTVGQANETLNDLAKATSDAKREEVLRRIRVDCSPMNQKWLVRIILKQLKIHLKKGVLTRFHPDALDEYNRTTSLRRVCSAFIGRHSSIRSKSNVEVFTSFSPMLAKNFMYDVDRIIPSMRGRPFCMDIKIDGERMLCHREGDKVMWFTRNAKDYTDKYGPVLTPLILAGVSAHKCILDGEVVTWDDATGSMVPFGSNRTYAREETEGGGTGTRWLFYVVFDILYAGGKGAEDEGAFDEIVRNAMRDTQASHAAGTELKAGNVTALPLGARLKVLQAVVTEKKHRLEIVQRKYVDSGNDAERKKQLLEFFEERAIHRNEEGLVVKDLTSHYMIGVGSRKLALWVKMKPEYSEQTGDLDLLILAAGFANGRMRSGLLSRFLLGVAVPSADGSPPSKFWPITRVGSGYSQDELEELNGRLEGSWKTFDSSDPPHFSFKNPGKDELTKWIAPEDSVCLQVKCMEIVKARDWPGIFCTMRFPRVQHIRFDKGPEGCNDTADLAALQACPRTSTSLTGGGKYAGSHGGSGRGGGAGGEGKRRKVAGRGRGRGGAGGGRQVSELFATDRDDAVSVEQSVFVTQNSQLEMCVIGTGFCKAPTADDTDEIDVDTWWGSTAPRKDAAGGDEDTVLTKQDMEYLIRTNGGLVTANPQASTAFVIVGSKNSITVKNMIAAGKYNVVGYRWVLKCIERKAYEFPSMRYIRAMSPDIRAHLSLTKDEYGDDYTEPTTAEALSQLMLNIPEPPRAAEDADLSWLSPLLTLDEQDRATLMDGPDFVFADTRRCLDLGSTEPPGDNPSPLTRELIHHSVLESAAEAVRLYGGDVARSLHNGVTHVVMDPGDVTRHGLIRQRVRDLHGHPDKVFNIRLVKPEWVWRCIELERLHPPNEEDVVVLT